MYLLMVMCVNEPARCAVVCVMHVQRCKQKRCTLCMPQTYGLHQAMHLFGFHFVNGAVDKAPLCGGTVVGVEKHVVPSPCIAFLEPIVLSRKHLVLPGSFTVTLMNAWAQETATYTADCSPSTCPVSMRIYVYCDYHNPSGMCTFLSYSFSAGMLGATRLLVQGSSSPLMYGVAQVGRGS